MIKKFLFFFNRHHKQSLILLFILMFIATFLEMVGLGFIFSIIGALNTASATSNIFIDKLGVFFKLDKDEILLYLLLIFFIFYIFKITFLTLYTWFIGNFLYMYREYLSSKVFREYLNQNFSYFYNRNSSEFIRNLTNEVDHFEAYLRSILVMVLEIIILIGIVTVLAYLNPYFAFWILVLFLSSFALYFFLLKEKLNFWGIQRQTSIQKRLQFMQESFDGIKIIKLLGRENFFFNKFKYYNVNLFKIAHLSYFFSSMPKLLVELLGIICITLAIFILHNSGKNLFEITQLLTVYVAASFRIFPSINKMATSFALMKLYYPSINLLYYELKSFKKENSTSGEKFSFNKNILVNIEKFKYPNSNNFEISDVKLNISKGEKIGIIGQSGSGKSTVVEILTGISDQPKGNITVDGNSIFSNLKGWQKLIGFVPQKIFILDESLRNNILFGLDRKKYTDDKILSIIKKISLENLLTRLPRGLDGNLREKGINLSGGEIQRIGLCRALIYDPEILFLDEATSSLDMDTESQILNELKIFKEKTIISIAHRINTLKNCEKIYRFDKGKIIDQGNYEKFKAQN